MFYDGELCLFVWQHAENRPTDRKNTAVPASWKENEKAGHTSNTKASRIPSSTNCGGLKTKRAPQAPAFEHQWVGGAAWGKSRGRGLAGGSTSLEVGFEVSKPLSHFRRSCSLCFHASTWAGSSGLPSPASVPAACCLAPRHATVQPSGTGSLNQTLV